MSQYILSPDDPNYPFPNQTNFTDPNLGPYGEPLGPSQLNPYVQGGVGSPTGPQLMTDPVLTIGKRNLRQKVKHGFKEGMSMLGDAWKKVKENYNPEKISKEDVKTTAKTSFKMGIVDKARSNPILKHDNFSLKIKPLNQRSMLSNAYGGAGSYKV